MNVSRPPDPERSLSLDPYSPREMASRVQAGGVAKAALGVQETLALAVLAGAFIGLGAMLATVAATDNGLGFGASRLLVGVAFSLGLVLVLVGGAELFTGNALIVMAWAEGKVTAWAMLRNWGLVYVGNFVGAAATALGIFLAGVHQLEGGKVGATAIALAHGKLALDFAPAFFRGVFCNALVCLAVWLALSSRTTTDKILCIVLPVTTFVAAGLEHSIANMYFVPMGMLLDSSLTWRAFVLDNLLPVTLGNIVGGSLMVGLVYWFIYLRKRQQ